MKKLKKFIFFIFISLIMYLLNSCIFFENLQSPNNFLCCEINGKSSSFERSYFVNEEIFCDIGTSIAMGDDMYMGYFKGLPEENINILIGTKNEDYTNENFYCINLEENEGKCPEAKISFSFNEPGEYLMYWGIFYFDENGNKLEQWDWDYGKSIKFTVVE